MNNYKNHYHHLAEFMHFGFVEEMQWQSLPYADRFKLFRHTDCYPVQNLIHGLMGDVQVFVFQYQYVIGGGAGHSGVRYAQTVAMFQSVNLSLPMFELKPKTFKSRLGSFFSGAVDFSNYPRFAEQYLVVGADEKEIGRVFNSQIIAALEANPGWTIEGGGGQFFMYKENWIVPPGQIQWLIETGRHVVSLFATEDAAAIAEPLR